MCLKLCQGNLGDQAAEYLAEAGVRGSNFFGGSMTEKEDLNSQAGCIGCGSKRRSTLLSTRRLEFFLHRRGVGADFRLIAINSNYIAFKLP